MSRAQMHSGKFAEEVARLPEEKKYILGQIPSGARSILDLGCGAGEFAHCLSRIFPGARVVGVDGDAEYIKTARGIYRSDNLEFVLSDIEHIEASQYEVLIFCGVIEHLPNVGVHLRSINELTAEGGTLFVATDNAHSIKAFLANIYYSFTRRAPALYLWHELERYYWWNQHIYTWTLSSLSTLMKLYGYRLLEYQFTNHYRSPLLLDRILDAVSRPLPGFRRHIVLKLQKEGAPTIVERPPQLEGAS